MFCPKCGAEFNEDCKICPNCDFNIENIKQSTSKSVVSENDIKNDTCPGIILTRNDSSKMNTVSIVLYVLRLIISIILAITVYNIMKDAAQEIINYGKNIADIQSVGGKTLEEAYYYEVGGIYQEFANVVRGLGVFCAGLLVIIGVKR